MQRPFLLWTRLLISGFLTACLLPAQAPAPAPTLNVLYTFVTAGEAAGLVEVQRGRFFGVVNISAGIFSITSAGSYQYFYGFPVQSGLGVYGLTPALNGQVYGSAANLGVTLSFSELFSAAPNDKVTTYSYNPSTQGVPFDEVQSPYGLYGFIGAPGGLTFDRFDYQGNATLLYTFPAGIGNLGGAPFLGLDGAFYGLMLMNNTPTAGIFRLTASGAFSWVIPSFPTAGVNNPISLIQAGNGNFYGTLPQAGTPAQGSPYGPGSIYEVTPSGQMTTIYQFPYRIFGIPETLLEASDGMIYGTARGVWGGNNSGYSSIFQLNPTTGQFKTVYGFSNGGVSGECDCSVIQGSDGKLYGTTLGGGTYQLGTIFALDLGLPPPKPHIALVEPSSEAPGKWVLLWGANLLGTTAVDFNGTPAASFAVASSQGVFAEVPTGATTGPITITTSNGSFTTTTSFTVE
jgi:uncharacterized repeat protein (TIGR03803 family)